MIASIKSAGFFLGLAIALALSTSVTILAPAAVAQDASLRVIQGKVFAAGGSQQGGAVVYLKDMKSLEIKTFISGQDGAYRFGQLGNADDYSLWAEFGGHKSKTKNISSFDSKKRFDISLHLEDK